MKRIGPGAFSAALVFVFVGASPAEARLSLRQKQFAKAQDKSFQAKIDAANKKCETKFDAKIDWESFKGEIDKQLDKKLHVSFSGFCGEPLDTMWSYCRDDKDAKSAIKGAIKTYRCKFGGKGKRKIELKGKTLTMWVDWKASNYGPYVKKYLGKKL